MASVLRAFLRLIRSHEPRMPLARARARVCELFYFFFGQRRARWMIGNDRCEANGVLDRLGTASFKAARRACALSALPEPGVRVATAAAPTTWAPVFRRAHVAICAHTACHF
jgi:hypothetical protein